MSLFILFLPLILEKLLVENFAFSDGLMRRKHLHLAEQGTSEVSQQVQVRALLHLEAEDFKTGLAGAAALTWMNAETKRHWR